MASSSCSWCSCVKLPANCVTGHLCNRCSIVCGCWPQCLQVGVFLFPHLCRVCVVLQWPLLSWFIKTHSPRDSAGLLSLGRGIEASSMRYFVLFFLYVLWHCYNLCIILCYLFLSLPLSALLTTECCHSFIHSSLMSYSSTCNLFHTGDFDSSVYVWWS